MTNQIKNQKKKNKKKRLRIGVGLVFSHVYGIYDKIEFQVLFFDFVVR